MTESVDHHEQGVDNPQKREHFKAALKIGAGLLLTTLVGKASEGDVKNDFGLKSLSDENQSEFNSRLFKILNAKIESGVGTDDEKDRARETVSRFVRITEMNDRIMDSYRNDVDEEGKPRLLSLYESKYSPYGIDDPEEMIDFVQIDKQIQNIIINPVSDFLTQREEREKRSLIDINLLLDGIAEKVELAHNPGGEAMHDRTAVVEPRDYEFIDTEQDGIFIIGSPGEPSEEGRHNYEEDLKFVREALKSIVPPGKVGVDLFSPERYGNEAEFGSEAAGIFKELESSSSINTDELSRALLYHELAGHGFDIEANDTNLYKYLAPEMIYRLKYLREKALGSEEWGRNYPGIQKTFMSKKANIISPGTVVSKEPHIKPPMIGVPLRDIRRRVDNYPDGIFVTGFYIKNALNDPAWFMCSESIEAWQDARKFFSESEGMSNSLGDFLAANEKKLSELRQNDQWLDSILCEIEPNAEAMSETSWLAHRFVGSEEGSQDLKELTLEMPKWTSPDSHWFDYLITVGQRMATMNMITNRSDNLSLLSEKEAGEIKRRLIIAASSADKELFAEMMAATLINPYIKAGENPYAEYLLAISKELRNRQVKIEPDDNIKMAVESLRKSESLSA